MKKWMEKVTNKFRKTIYRDFTWGWPHRGVESLPDALRRQRDDIEGAIQRERNKIAECERDIAQYEKRLSQFNAVLSAISPSGLK
jgi:hypothetical protein